MTLYNNYAVMDCYNFIYNYNVMTIPYLVLYNGIFLKQKLCLSYLGINACDLNNGGCQHTCISTGSGTRRCSCRAGFRLLSDGRTCLRDFGKNV